jgi:hypothetical protein
LDGPKWQWQIKFDQGCCWFGGECNPKQYLVFNMVDINGSSGEIPKHMLSIQSSGKMNDLLLSNLM